MAIAGYTPLSDDDVAAINEIKNFEAKWNGIVDRLKARPGIDGRSLALAVTYCEDGFSRAVRAIAQPMRLVDHG